MKKLLVPGLLMFMAMGLAQRQANAGGFSIGISIGDSHRYHPAPIIAAPPVVVSQPAPVCAQPSVVVPQVCGQPPVVVVQPQPTYVVRECDRPYGYYRYDWHNHYGRYGHYGHEGRYERHRR